MTKRIEPTITADDLLRSYNPASLAPLARMRGMNTAGASRPKILQFLTGVLYDGDSVANVLTRLSPVERIVLDRVVLLGGEVITASLRHQLGAAGIVDAPGREQVTPENSTSRFESVIARLGTCGLLFGANIGPYRRQLEIGTAGQYLFIPDGVLRHIPAPSLPVETAASPIKWDAADASTLLRDFYALLSLVRDEPLRVTARGQIPKRELFRADAVLRIREDVAKARSEWDLGRLPLLRALGEDLKLLVSGTEGLHVGPSVPQFLAQPAATRQRRLFETYLRTKRWSELTRIPHMSISPRFAMNGPRIVSARRCVVREVAQLPPGAWIPLWHLIDRIRTRSFEFLVQRDWDYSHYYYGSTYYSDPNPYGGSNSLGLSFQSRGGGPVDWETIEGGFIRGVIEALHWLGGCDVASSTADGAVSVFRLTEAGARLVAGAAPPAIPREPHVVVQPNFQILAFEPTGEDVLYMLDRIAQRVRAEQVVEYYLTRAAIYRAQRSGMQVGEIIAFLDRVSSSPLPQNVRRTLEEWDAGHQRIVVRRGAAAIQVVNPSILDSLYADSSLAELLGRRLSPFVALVPAANLHAVHLHLLTHNHQPLPALTEGNDAGGGASITIDGDGCIHFTQAVPSMYVRATLRPLVEDRGDGTFRLTPQSIAAAMGAESGSASMSADDMIAVLEHLHAGPLSEDVVKSIRRWTRSWGHGALGEVTVLQVDTPAVMRGLLDDPDLRPFLQPVPGNPVLATLARDDAEHVRSLLQSIGMDLGSAPYIAQPSP